MSLRSALMPEAMTGPETIDDSIAQGQAAAVAAIAAGNVALAAE